MSKFDDSQELIAKWPGNKTIPRLLRVLYDENRGPGDWEISMFIEALFAAAESEEDLDLIRASWGDDDEDETDTEL